MAQLQTQDEFDEFKVDIFDRCRKVFESIDFENVTDEPPTDLMQELADSCFASASCVATEAQRTLLHLMKSSDISPLGKQVVSAQVAVIFAAFAYATMVNIAGSDSASIKHYHRLRVDLTKELKKSRESD